MRSIKLFSFFLFFLLLTFQIASADVTNWELLGKKKVRKKGHSAVININTQDKIFGKIKLSNGHFGIKLFKIDVHFANGEKKRIEIQNYIAKGKESESIDLPLNSGSISKVVIFFKSKKRTDVSVWGKQHIQQSVNSKKIWTP